MNEYSFECSVNAATYLSPIAVNETSCLDHVWHNLTYNSQVFIMSPPIADHLSVTAFFDCIIPETKRNVHFRCFSKRNIELFLNNFTSGFLHLNGFSRNVGEFADKLLNWLIQIANKYFPIKEKTMTDKRLVTPWIMRCINKKHLWLKLLKRGIIYYSSFE